MQQKLFEEKLALQASEEVGQGEVQNTESTGIKGEEAAKEEPKDVEREEMELERTEMEELDMGEDMGFFYEDKGKEVQDDDDIGIGARVAARRQGHLHNGGGQME